MSYFCPCYLQFFVSFLIIWFNILPLVCLCFSSKIEAAYQDAVALRRQEELIREEEAAGQAETELKGKRGGGEKEKRAKKKQVCNCIFFMFFIEYLFHGSLTPRLMLIFAIGET